LRLLLFIRITVSYRVKKRDKSIFFRLVPRSDPAGSGSVPHGPNSCLNLLRIEPIPTLRSNPGGQKKASTCVEAFFVIPLVQNSNSFLEDLRRLNQLKDIMVRGDSNVSKKLR